MLVKLKRTESKKIYSDRLTSRNWIIKSTYSLRLPRPSITHVRPVKSRARVNSFAARVFLYYRYVCTVRTAKEKRSIGPCVIFRPENELLNSGFAARQPPKRLLIFRPRGNFDGLKMNRNILYINLVKTYFAYEKGSCRVSVKAAIP